MIKKPFYLIFFLLSIPFSREIEQIGSFAGNIKNVVIQQKYAYLYDSSDGIKIVDISNPFYPSEVGSINIDRDTRNLIIRGNYLFSVDGSDGLTVLDVSDKTNPQEIENYTDGSTFYDLKIEGDHAFALTGIGISGSLQILDITNPVSISQISQLSLNGISLGTSLDIEEDLVVVTDFFNIHAVEISDINVPVLKSSVTATGTNHISLKGRLGFISRSESGLDVYDFNDPENPELIFEYDDADANIKYSAIFGRYLAVSDYDGSLRVLDAFNPLDLVPIIQFNLLTNPEEIQIYHDLIFLADSEGGLRIFETERNNLYFTPILSVDGKPNAAQVTAAGTPPQIFLSISSYYDSRLEVSYSAFTDIDGTIEFTISSDDLPLFQLDSIAAGLTQNSSVQFNVSQTTLNGTILTSLAGHGILCDIEVSGTGISQAPSLALSNIQFVNNSGQSYTVMDDSGMIEIGNYYMSLEADDGMYYEIYKDGSSISGLFDAFPFSDSGLGYGEYNCYQANFYFNGMISNLSGETCTKTAFFNNMNSFSGSAENSNGSCWGDYDNDGDPDLFVTNYGLNQLFRNDGSNVWTSAFETSFISTDSSTACSWTDIDNDGSLDMYISNSYNLQNELFRNVESNFERIIDDPIIEDSFTSFAACWFDADGDDTLDAFISNYGIDNQLFINSGNGTFELDQLIPVTSDGGFSYHAACLDINGDGFSDIFVTNDSENFLYYNDSEGGFTRVYNEPPVEIYSQNIGTSWGDYDNDGDPDVFITIKDDNDRLFRNEGDGSFSDQSQLLSNEENASIGSTWLDYDNDGNLDLIVVGPTFTSLIYENYGGGFTVYGSRETFQITNDTLINTISSSDVDNDGDLDLFFTVAGENLLFENAADENLGYWLKIKPVGRISSILPYGTKVSVFADINGENQTVSRWLMSQNGHNSQNDLNLHFGLADAAVVDSITVYFSSGVVNTVYDIFVNQLLEITETDYGDVDHNGNVQAYDASILLGEIVGNYELNRSQGVAGDVDLDDDIDHSDAQKILQSVLNLITLPDPEPITGWGSISFAENIEIENNQISVPINMVNADHVRAVTAEISFPSHVNFVEFQWYQSDNSQLNIVNEVEQRIKLSVISPVENIPDGELAQMIFNLEDNIPSDSLIVIESVFVNDAPEQTQVDVLDVSSFLGLAASLPQEFILYPAYPNPFNPVTRISFAVPDFNPSQSGQAEQGSISYRGEGWGEVRLNIYDIQGKIVETLINGFVTPGYHTIDWNAEGLPAGVYFMRFAAADVIHFQKVMLIK